MAKAPPLKLTENNWLALIVGNSRLHWAWFIGNTLENAWDVPHLSSSAIDSDLEFDINVWLATMPKLVQTRLEGLKFADLPLWIASVVPDRLKFWQNYPNAHVITLDRIPLQGTYPTLGIDRALGLWGAGITLGWPVLAIDAGTALTFTGANRSQQLMGGAILPGLGLQLQSLSQKTAALPIVSTAEILSPPARWALNTEDAISSGVIYTLIAGIRNFIEAWWQEFPDSAVVLTGGDRAVLFNYLQVLDPEIAIKIVVDAHPIFWGMRSVVMGIGD